MEPLGGKVRRQRRRMGLSLDELAGRTRISKPYLSLIETGRVANPPSDEKLRRLETALGFSAGELVGRAHLQRTPTDVRAVLHRLMQKTNPAQPSLPAQRRGSGGGTIITAAGAEKPSLQDAVPMSNNLDEAYLSGILQEMADQSSGNVEPLTTRTIPVINRVSAGYPSDFTDLSYPRGVADEYISCPDVQDPEAFAARVHGDSMSPKYTPGDIVIFSPAVNPRDGDDCFIRFADGHTTFKRAFFENDAAGAAMIRLQPRNAKYNPQIIPAEEVTGLYKAVFRYQRIDAD